MNLKLKELSRTILRLDSEGSLESLYRNYSACLRHLVGYLSQKDDSGRTEQERKDMAMHLPLEHIPASPDPSMWQAEKTSVDDDDLGAPSVENTAEGCRIWFASSN
jgi:hypothetical protein